MRTEWGVELAAECNKPPIVNKSVEAEDINEFLLITRDRAGYLR
jgi:hypothetical protein